MYLKGKIHFSFYNFKPKKQKKDLNLLQRIDKRIELMKQELT